MSKIKFVFFDLANTLVHQPGFYLEMEKLFYSKGYNIESSFLKKTHRILSEEIQFPDKTSFDFYLKFNASWIERLNVSHDEELINDIYKRGKGHSWEVFKDTNYLSEIKIPMGIISNWDKSLPDKLNNFFDMPFNPIVGSALVGYQKPNHEIFNYALNQVGYKPEEVLMIGDSIRLDIIPALEVGFQAILIDRENIFSKFNGLKIQNLNELNMYL